MEPSEELRVQCHNDLCLQSPDEVDEARDVGSTSVSFVKSLRLIALPYRG